MTALEILVHNVLVLFLSFLSCFATGPEVLISATSAAKALKKRKLEMLRDSHAKTAGDECFGKKKKRKSIHSFSLFLTKIFQ